MKNKEVEVVISQGTQFSYHSFGVPRWLALVFIWQIKGYRKLRAFYWQWRESFEQWPYGVWDKEAMQMRNGK